MSLRRLLAIIIKEITHILRDRRSLGTISSLPIIQLVLYGYLSNDVRHIPTAVFDQSISQESRRLVAAFANTRYFDIKYYPTSPDQVRRLIDGGQARIGIIVPPDFAERLHARRPVQVQVVVDASEPTSARTVLSVASSIGQSLGADVSVVPQGPAPAVEVRTRAWYNPNLVNANFIVPGILAVVLTFVTTFQAIILIVRERELGTLEQLIVTPIKPVELMLGKVIPLIVLGYIELTITLILASLWFHVPVKGSLVLLYVLSLAFFFSTLGIGTLISTVSRTFQQAAQLSQIILLPSILLSGFIFPRESLPIALRWLGAIFPLTYFVIVVRGIMLKGVGIAYLWPQIAALLVLGLGVFALAITRFQKKLE